MNPDDTHQNHDDDVDVDDVIDEEPEYLDSNDVIEVATLDDTTDHVPMDDDDDDDDDVVIDDIDEERITHDGIESIQQQQQQVNTPPSPELFCTLTCHTGPVYTCAVLAIDTSTTTQIETTTTSTTTTTPCGV